MSREIRHFVGAVGLFAFVGAMASTAVAAPPTDGVDLAAGDRGKSTVERAAAPAAGAAAEGATAVGKRGKARLAVLPAVFARHFKPVLKTAAELSVSGDVNLKAIVSAQNESRMETPSFTLSLVEAFVASRKFDVLERTRLQEVLDEVDFGDSDYGDVARVVPLGQALNADYVVLPAIELIHIVGEAKKIPYVDTVKPRYRAKMIARMRVVEVGTTRVVSAFTEEVQVENVLRSKETFAASEVHDAVLAMYAAQSTRLVYRTLEAIYPVRLLDMDGAKVVLNRGEGAVAVGDEFDVFELGRGYVDPDTGETLGRREVRRARIRVVRVMPKIADAEVVEGQDALEGSPATYLCRETTGSIAKKTRVKPDLRW